MAPNLSDDQSRTLPGAVKRPTILLVRFLRSFVKTLKRNKKNWCGGGGLDALSCCSSTKFAKLQN